MPILKKKKQKRPKRERKKKPAQSSQLGGKIYMPKRKSNDRVVKRKKASVFKKQTASNLRNGHRKRRMKKFHIPYLLVYIFVPLVFIGLLYLSVRFIINTRTAGDEKDLALEYVIGLDEIPAYPGSEFIFQNSLKEVSVANFVSSGNSAYRLPLNRTVAEAYEYYRDVLGQLGWEHVLSVPVGSEEMKHGEYWVKEDHGLRIYSKFNDLWYESVSTEQASTGLRDKVEREIERDLLLASKDLQELLPDFPWIVKIPKEYIISYRTSDYKDYRTVEFKKIGTAESVAVIPIGRSGDVLDNYLNEYIDILNSTQEEENGSTWGVTNTLLTYTSYGRALQGTINANGRTDTVAVVSNTYDGVTYVIHSNSSDESFFEYILANMEPQGMHKD